MGLFVAACVLVCSSCGDDPVAPGIPVFTVSWPDQEALMLLGEQITIGVSKGRHPYRLVRETNRQVAVTTLLGDTIHVDAVDFGIDSLVVEDSAPQKITIRMRIGTPSSGVIGINGVIKAPPGAIWRVYRKDPDRWGPELCTSSLSQAETKAAMALV